ncbi:hypothetical protein [Streptomyces sp. NPDC004296]|uniref:hypothetical protein n=1 Tax=Streptomyces sp. NPDC004296 TaxID=3364697 RepID=UPI0036BFD32A
MNQDASIDEVTARLRTVGQGLEQPLVQVMFEFQNSSLDVASLRGSADELPVIRVVEESLAVLRAAVRDPHTVISLA